MPPPWCTPEKGEKGAVIGEIFFGPNSVSLGGGDTRELDKLADVLATFQHAQVHDFDKPNLLFLGDTSAAEAPKPKPELGKRRAAAVEQYLRSKLPAAAMPNMKFESAAKGGALLPGMQPPPGQTRQGVVQIINKGKRVTRMAAPLKKAATVSEALQVAQQAFREFPPEHPNQATRIKYWIEGPGKASVERGDDAYLHPAVPGVKDQAQVGTRELSASEMANLKGRFPRIGLQLMTVAARGNPLKEVREVLVTIDLGIMSGVDFIIKKKADEASTFGSAGLEQLAQFISQRGNDSSSFYHAYGYGGVAQQPETDTAMGRWRVKVDKWTWIYELRLGGSATWKDVINGQTGVGHWRMTTDEIVFTWQGSENKETWRPLPLNPQGQKGRWIWKDGKSFEINAVREAKFF